MSEHKTTDDQPWTPSPWTATPFNAHANDTFPKAIAIWIPDGGHERNKASADLIALAPEMAAAILEWGDDRQRRHVGHVRGPELRLFDLAERLRGIGGTNE